MAETVFNKLTIFATLSQQQQQQNWEVQSAEEGNLRQQPEKKGEGKHPLCDFQLTSHVQKVAREILQFLKRSLEEEAEKSTLLAILFSEIIAASQLVSMVLGLFSPRQLPSDLQAPFHPKEHFLEMLLRRTPEYQRDLQRRSQSTVADILSEAGQSVKENVLAALCRDIVNTVVEDLGFALAMNMTAQLFLSAQLHCLLRDLLAQRILRCPSPGMARAAVPRMVSFGRGTHRVPGQSKNDTLAAEQRPAWQDSLPPGSDNNFVGNVLHRLRTLPKESWEVEMPTEESSRLSAQKVTFAILSLVQEDLECALPHSQDILPYEEHMSALQILKELLGSLTAQRESQEDPSEQADCSSGKAEDEMLTLESGSDHSSCSDLSLRSSEDDSAPEVEEAPSEHLGAATEEVAMSSSQPADHSSPGSQGKDAGSTDPPHDDACSSAPAEDAIDAAGPPPHRASIDTEPKKARRKGCCCTCSLSGAWCRVGKFLRSTLCFRKTYRKNRKVSPGPEAAAK